jgi:hypothetical protein
VHHNNISFNPGQQLVLIYVDQGSSSSFTWIQHLLVCTQLTKGMFPEMMLVSCCVTPGFLWS